MDNHQKDNHNRSPPFSFSAHGTYPDKVKFLSNFGLALGEVIETIETLPIEDEHPWAIMDILESDNESVDMERSILIPTLPLTVTTPSTLPLTATTPSTIVSPGPGPSRPRTSPNTSASAFFGQNEFPEPTLPPQPPLPVPGTSTSRALARKPKAPVKRPSPYAKTSPGATQKKNSGRGNYNPDDVYLVETIVDKRFEKDKTPRYFIKWVGYDSTNNTWEPLENLPETLVTKYENKKARERELNKAMRKMQSDLPREPSVPSLFKVKTEMAGDVPPVVPPNLRKQPPRQKKPALSPAGGTFSASASASTWPLMSTTFTASSGSGTQSFSTFPGTSTSVRDKSKGNGKFTFPGPVPPSELSRAKTIPEGSPQIITPPGTSSGRDSVPEGIFSNKALPRQVQRRRIIEGQKHVWEMRSTDAEAGVTTVTTMKRNNIQFRTPPVRYDAKGYQMVETETNLIGKKLKQINGLTSYLDELIFVTEFEGQDNSVLVKASHLGIHFPQEVIHFYEDRLIWIPLREQQALSRARAGQENQ